MRARMSLNRQRATAAGMGMHRERQADPALYPMHVQSVCAPWLHTVLQQPRPQSGRGVCPASRSPPVLHREDVE
jgi:hypothetical protein